MKENRTSKVFRSKFRKQDSKNDQRGFIGRQIPVVCNNDIREKLKNETKIRSEIQSNIKDMVKENTRIEEIREFLNQDKYKAYEQYFEMWIQNWIVKLNPTIKSIIEKACNRNKKQEEIVEELENANSEVYKLYKNQIDEYVKSEIETRKRKAMQEEMKKQQRLNEQEEEK